MAFARTLRPGLRLALFLLVAAGLILGTAFQPAPARSASPLPPLAARLCFLRAGQPAAVTRPLVLPPDRLEAARLLMEALLAGPTPDEAGQGIVSAFPPGSGLLSLQVDGETASATVSLPAGFLEGGLDAAASDAMVLQVVRTLEVLGFLRFHLLAPDPQEPGRLRPVSNFLHLPPPVRKSVLPDDAPAPPQRETMAGQPPIYGQGQSAGALSGKTVFVSAGHGWLWDGSDWLTQRVNTCGLVEDLSNAEAVDELLVRYLWNAGADVWTVRERDMNSAEVIVDNDGGPSEYQETGLWRTSTFSGYQGRTYRFAEASANETATATWIPNLPREGDYAVYVWYRNGDNRASDALYRIQHAGGTTEVRLNQEVHGLTWRYLGTYHFQGGTAGRVTLSNRSSQPGQAIIADAVRFGGGMGSVDYGGGKSGRPRYEESCRPWAQYLGVPAGVYPDDVVCRPRYAEWEKEAAEDAIYISWHSNGYTGGCNPASGTGTESYVHDSLTPAGSVALQNAVHDELVGDIRALWDPAWVDRDKKTADFGELRELETIPGVLIEVGFHDRPADAAALKAAAFRLLAARAVYQGIVKYFAARDGVTPHLLPEPPCFVTARSTAPGQVTLNWHPPLSGGAYGDPAERYKVYVGTSGRAFDNGRFVTGTQITLGGLAPGRLYFFRVTAVNAGGESFPCGTAAVRTPAFGDSPAALLVDGFDRLDAAALVYEATAGLGSVGRMFLERMNSYDYAIQHGQDLAGCGVPFDFAENEAVAAGDVALGGYTAVDWILGEESTVDETFSSAEQAKVSAFLAAGGNLLLSGAEVGWDLDNPVSSGDQAFYHNWLRADYESDDAGTYRAVPAAGGILAGLPAFSFDNGTHGTYDVDYPDRIAAQDGATVNLLYQGGLGGNAGLQYGGPYRLVYLAFPLETIYPDWVRGAVLCRSARFLGLSAEMGSERVFLPLVLGGTRP